jgi:hypothetical protein
MHACAAELLEKAADCERKAEEARDPHVKRIYRDLAAQWRDLARQINMLRY